MATTRPGPLFADLSGTKTLSIRWAPAVDIIDTNTDITIKAELPGVEAKDIAVSLENGVLTMKGARQTEKEIHGENYHCIERAQGAFNRSFAIPVSIDSDKVTAEFHGGLLTI